MGKRRKNNLEITYFALLLLILAAGCTNNPADKSTGKKDANTVPAATFKTISAGSTDSGDVLVELTPKGTKSEKFEVDVSVNTHSVDLSQFNLMKITLLEYEGKTIRPVSAPKLSGHHSSGELIFDTGKEIKSFKITIKGIPAVDERVFEWS